MLTRQTNATSTQTDSTESNTTLAAGGGGMEGGEVNIDLCQSSFTGTLGDTSPIQPLLKIPPHVKHVAALSCEISVPYWKA